MINSDEYQTPKKYLIAAKDVMGSIDLDPFCSSINFQRIAKIDNDVIYYDGARYDGYKEAWVGNVWANPPYSKPNLTKAANKVVDQYHNFNQLIYLVPSFTSENWYQLLLSKCSAICLPNHRIKHLLNGKIQANTRHASTFFYFGRHPHSFYEEFSKFGKILKIKEV